METKSECGTSEASINSHLSLKENCPSTRDISTWSVDDLSLYLAQNGIRKEICSLFTEHRINGVVLQDLSQDSLVQIGVKAIGDQLQLLNLIKKLITVPTPTVPFADILIDFKVFNDPIHGHIDLHPLCVKVIDTPQFQRLRHIKQLGGLEYVFPGATNNRFEHSIGVCHLAGQLVRILQSRQPMLGITDVDILCVELAGLCHDLGHGPFSHLFDGNFIPKARPGLSHKHESASVRMLDHLVEKNNLKSVFASYGLHERDLIFIKEQVAGPLETSSGTSRDWPYKGRDKGKSFLYEIVANKRNGIDVDKWDYFVRDCHYLGIRNNFDHMRSMKFVRVLEVDGQYQICTRDKEANNLYSMFNTRSILHRTAYKHQTCLVVEGMIVEALLSADQFLKYTGSKGKKFCLSETIDDMEAFTKVTDHVIYQILLSEDPNMKPARDIIEKLHSRQFYKCIGEGKNASSDNHFSQLQSSDITRQIIDVLSDEELEGLPRLTCEDIIVRIATFDYGMKEKDPIENVRFYQKSNPDIAFKLQRKEVSQMLPEHFLEKTVRIYLKNDDAYAVAARSFDKWCRQMNLTPKTKSLKSCSNH